MRNNSRCRPSLTGNPRMTSISFLSFKTDATTNPSYLYSIHLMYQFCRLEDERTEDSPSGYVLLLVLVNISCYEGRCKWPIRILLYHVRWQVASLFPVIIRIHLYRAKEEESGNKSEEWRDKGDEEHNVLRHRLVRGCWLLVFYITTVFKVRWPALPFLRSCPSSALLFCLLYLHPLFLNCSSSGLTSSSFCLYRYLYIPLYIIHKYAMSVMWGWALGKRMRIFTTWGTGFAQMGHCEVDDAFGNSAKCSFSGRATQVLLHAIVWVFVCGFCWSETFPRVQL